jgi:hypothetical protein
VIKSFIQPAPGDYGNWFHFWQWCNICVFPGCACSSKELFRISQFTNGVCMEVGIFFKQPVWHPVSMECRMRISQTWSTPHFQPLNSLPPIDENSEVLKLDVYSVYLALLTLNPRRVSGPCEDVSKYLLSMQQEPFLICFTSFHHWLGLVFSRFATRGVCSHISYAAICSYILCSY